MKKNILCLVITVAYSLVYLLILGGYVLLVNMIESVRG